MRSPWSAYPAALEDAMSAVSHVLKTTDVPFILAGDSAGAWLAASVAHALNRPEPRLIGQILIYPTLGGDIRTGSYKSHADAPLLSTEDIIWYGQQFMGDQPHQRMGPLVETDFEHLPPTVIFAATCDPLYDDGPAYVRQICAAGGKAVCQTEDGLVHGYLRAAIRSRKSLTVLPGLWPPSRWQTGTGRIAACQRKRFSGYRAARPGQTVFQRPVCCLHKHGYSRSGKS